MKNSARRQRGLFPVSGASTAVSASISELNLERRPLVTIAIPTFNRASWLGGCVVAALAQTYQNLEILVSDNASTDETQQVLRELSDSRLRVVRQAENIGLLPNWNACLADARGDYIIFVSDDDRVAPWLLERCMDLVQKEPGLPIVVAVCDIHSERTWPGVTSQNLTTGIWSGADILLEFLKENITATMCSIVMRTDALRERGGFSLDLPFAADVAAWTPLLFEGKAGLVNEAGATYYVHSARETSRLRIEQILRDGWAVADLISHLAGQFTIDLNMRRRIQLQSRRCFAGRALMALSAFRKEGGTLAEVLVVACRYRRELIQIDPANLFKLSRPIAIIFAPRRMVDGVRYLKRIFSGMAGLPRQRL
jgi:glycosyltransferase involved in cell wall biosynthesis